MIFRMVMVFIASIGLFMGLVRTFQASAHLRWSSQRLWSIWLIAAVSAVGLAVLGYVNATQLPAQRVVGSIALGILLGTLLLITRKPEWPKI